MNDQPPANPLARALAAGQAWAFAELYDRLGRSMLRVASAMLGNADQAEDAVQEVFVNLARRRERLADVGDIDAYVFASLRYAVIAKVAAARKEQRHLRQFAQRSASDVCSQPMVQDDLVAALSSLPAAQREVVVLKIDAGLTFAQIGVILGVSQNTAASRYRYAIEKLRNQLEKDP